MLLGRSFCASYLCWGGWFLVRLVELSLYVYVFAFRLLASLFFFSTQRSLVQLTHQVLDLHNSGSEEAATRLLFKSFRLCRGTPNGNICEACFFEVRGASCT